MGDTRVLLTAHCVVLCLFQMIALSSEQFTVNGLQQPVLAQLGGNLELTCELSPPQQAKHMEIRWFRNRFTEPVYLYRTGKDLLGKIISKYVERTELLKDDIGKGKVTLRIFNVTADDDGSYHCFFKDDKFYEEHITEVKVTAISSDIHILMHPPNTKGVMLECHSSGWFPKPHMEWRDNKGQYIPAASEFHLQDENKTFTMKIFLLIKANSPWNVTCYLQNLVTHKEESINIVLSGELFSWKILWIMILTISPFVMIAFHMTYIIQLLPCGLTPSLSMPNHDNGQCEAPQSKGCCSNRISPWIKSAILLIISVFATTVVMLTLHLQQRVPDSDKHFELDTLWLEDISVILCVLMMFNNKLMLLIYFRLCGYKTGDKKCKYKMLRFSHSLFFIISFGTILLHLQLLNKDPLFFIYKRWMTDMIIVLAILLGIFNLKRSTKLLSYITWVTDTIIPDCWEPARGISGRQSTG